MVMAPVRLFRSRLGSQALFQGLSELFPTEDIPLYDLRPEGNESEVLSSRLEEADYLVFSSASGVEFLLGSGIALPDRLTCLCIGPVTARALAARSSAPSITAPDISAQGLAQAAAEHWAAHHKKSL